MCAQLTKEVEEIANKIDSLSNGRKDARAEDKAAHVFCVCSSHRVLVNFSASSSRPRKRA